MVMKLLSVDQAIDVRHQYLSYQLQQMQTVLQSQEATATARMVVLFHLMTVGLPRRSPLGHL